MSVRLSERRTPELFVRQRQSLKDKKEGHTSENEQLKDFAKKQTEAKGRRIEGDSVGRNMTEKGEELSCVDGESRYLKEVNKGLESDNEELEFERKVRHEADQLAK
jgi:hypothetical protein